MANKTCICFLFLFTFASGQCAAVMQEQLQVLSEVLSGPAQGRSLALHFDPDLPEDTQQRVMALPEVRHTPHLILNMNSNYTWWPRASSLLHVVLYLRHTTQIIQWLWHDWKPRNLLLLSLASKHCSSILNEDMLRSVEALALITAEEGDSHRIYTLLPFSSPWPHLLGHWNPHHFTHWHILFPHRFSHFSEYNFQLTTWPQGDEPILYWDGTTNKSAGLTVKILDTLSLPLNFTYTLIPGPAGIAFGSFVNGSWTGVLELLHNKKSNFTVNGFFLTEERAREFDASIPYLVDNFGVFFRKPQHLPQWKNIIMPYPYTVWIAICVSLVAATFLTVVQVMLIKNLFVISLHLLKLVNIYNRPQEFVHMLLVPRIHKVYTEFNHIL